VNYLIGPSKSQYNSKYKQGKGIPVDLALGFHTDAGVTGGDTVVGTLGIYSTTRNNGLFPNGQSKLASRDLADMVQSQVVHDIRLQASPAWTRRGLWDREYSEAWRPAVPVMLLELLSHQNLADMKYGLDPRFKFLVSRSVYKGITRYLAVQKNEEAVIQPLPPDHMSIEVLDGLKIKLSWQGVKDPLEPSAVPTGYRVYIKTGEGGFDQGTSLADTFMIMTLPERGKIYSFRVTATNSGGESFPGETLSVALLTNQLKPVLLVNAFDRVCGPAVFDQGNMAGIAWWQDEGVPYNKDYSQSGNQYDFDRGSAWLNDDSQGWGASYADREASGVNGNSFSFPFIHGKALLDAGCSFISVSDEVFELPYYNTDPYMAVDIIFGEERGTTSLADSSIKEYRVFTAAMMNSIRKISDRGGSIFISGAYIGTDMTENNDSNAIRFAKDVLHYTWRTGHATNVGSVTATSMSESSFPVQMQFNTNDHPDLYKVESPDAIEPAGEGAWRLYRYSSGGRSAGVAYKGAYRTVALGFPFESILTEEQRTEMMKDVMRFFR
jgi:hypothetical protein